MAIIDTELEQQLKAMPNRMVDLIVRTQGDATPHLGWLASNNVKVRQQYKLTPGIAITSTGADALKLLGQDWVKSIEEDGAVKAT